STAGRGRSSSCHSASSSRRSSRRWSRTPGSRWSSGTVILAGGRSVRRRRARSWSASRSLRRLFLDGNSADLVEEFLFLDEDLDRSDRRRRTVIHRPFVVGVPVRAESSTEITALSDEDFRP